MQVVKGLFGSKQQEGACEAGAGAVDFEKSKRHQGSELPGERLQSQHWMSKRKGQKAGCKLCMFDCIKGTKPYQAKTSYFCEKCGDYLHFECFKEYHTEASPVSQFGKEEE